MLPENLTKRNAALGRMLAAALLAVASLHAQSLDQVLQMAPRSLPLPEVASAKSVFINNSSKIDPALQILVSQVATKGIGDLEATAKGLGLSVDEEKVAVSLYAENQGGANALRAAIEARGGEVTAIVDNVVLASVPVNSVEQLGRQNQLHYMAGQAVYQPTYQRGARPMTSEGIGLAHAIRLHEKGITGKGVKVGIIDFGFQGYAAMQSAGRLPAPRNTALFNKVQKLENGEVHGAGCAEIVHQMAPDAAIYLAVIDGEEGQIVAAADWMVQQGVNIISFSGGTPGVRGDGKDTLSMKVDQVSTQYGILWVIAAGNEADHHWMGPSQTVNQDGSLRITPDGGNVLAIRAVGNGFGAIVKWDDWGSDPRLPASSQDLDAYLYAFNPQTKESQLVAKSTNPQQGNGRPMEFVSVQSQPGQIFLLRIQAVKVNRNFKVHAFLVGPAQLYPVVKSGSMASPGTAKEGIAVAAVDAVKGTLSSYSSQGPTDDNRVKPDIAAPDNTSSEAYAQEGGRFPGTSAAAPHAAGFAALLKQLSPEAKSPQLRVLLTKYVRPMGTGAPNYEYGHGHIDADRVPLAGGEDHGPTDGGGGGNLTIRLPPGWGGAVAASRLDRMRSDRGSDLDVKVVVGKAEYRVGDGMKIGYRASGDCYFLLLHRSSAGEYTLIAPDQSDRAQLAGGQRYAMPDGNETIRVREPLGSEEIILICSKKPIDLNRANPDDLSVSVARYEVKK